MCSFFNPHQINQQQPETDGGNASNASDMLPGTDKDDAAAEEPLPAEVWMRRPRGGMQSRGPAYTALTERVKKGNDLVSDSLLFESCIKRGGGARTRHCQSSRNVVYTF